MKRLSVEPFSNQFKLPWIKVAPDNPYFFTENNTPWIPIGQNDSISWHQLNSLFREKDVKAVDSYLAFLAAHGVTCLRLMLEYSQHKNRYLEKPVGYFQPAMVKLWDHVFTLCGKHGLRLLLTPFDTYWMWKHWKHHPYNKINGGPCGKRSRWLICQETIAAMKGRLEFATRRWGGCGVLFAWDLWNEISPKQSENNASVFDIFISEISVFLRKLEMELYGRTHPQTVSVFAPLIRKHPEMANVIFRHPLLDFASTHFYDNHTINKPQNTVSPAIRTGELVREAVSHISDNRPFFDSEHGPIHTFNIRHTTLPEPFDDEYFRHIQWAHFASGGAGGGMRWPYRHPHSLTKGMHLAQQSLAKFSGRIHWNNFDRRNLSQEVKVSSRSFAVFACGNKEQIIIWLLRKDKIAASGRLIRGLPTGSLKLSIPGMANSLYKIIFWDTLTGNARESLLLEHIGGDELLINLPAVDTDLALVISKA